MKRRLLTLSFLALLVLTGAPSYGQSEVEQVEVQAEDPPAVAQAPAPEEGVAYFLPTLLKGRTYVVKDDKWTPGDGKQTAKYTILYYAAGWCATCRRNVLDNIDLYNKLIKSDPDIELIMFNLDRSADFAEKWATDIKMPWPVLLQKDFPPDLRHLMPLGIPIMILVDKDGREIMRSPILIRLLKAAE